MGDAPARVAALEAATAVLDRFFETFYRQRPVSATFTGLHEYDARLPDWSADGLARAADEMRSLRRDLEMAGRVPDEAVTTFPQQVDLALADVALEIALAEHESRHFVHANPSLWTGEAIFGVLSLVTRDFAPVGQRLRAAQERLDAIPAFLGTVPGVLAAAPSDWIARARRECRAAVVLFGEALPAWVDARAAGDPRDTAGIDVAAWAAASANAARSFVTLDTWLESSAASRASEGAGDLLELLIRRGHWDTTPISELKAEAAEALDEATSRLETMARPFGGWPAVQELLAAEHPPAEAYLARFEERWRACRQAAHDHDLVSWPEAPLRYVPLPAHTREAAASLYYLNYRSPAPFDDPGVFDYVVPPLEGLSGDALEARLRAMNDSVITLNHVVHHGAIGHHVQNHHAYAGASRVGRVAAVDTANRIAMFSGGSLAEGWACYVCDLMEEIGFLSPLERLAQQHTRVRIAARAVADLSMHTGALTPGAAARLYVDRAYMTTAAADGEATRNSMFPGTAVMYWLGTRGLHRLRGAVRARQGASFSMRAFHDRVLSYGAIPVMLISKLMLAEETTP
jgi:uncharacterized protein (DUF885 family)